MPSYPIVQLNRFAGKISVGTREKTSRIKRWLDESLTQFDEENAQHVPTTVALYACPIYGWISLCINCGDSDLNREVNCPDFDYVEYDLISISEWQKAYESEIAEIRISNTESLFIDHEKGDEAFNEPFFKFLRALIADYFPSKHRRPVWVGVQILDSSYADFWKLV